MSLLQKNEISKDMLDPQKIPQHIAVIMDGNGRWAKKRGLPRVFGHRKGVETFEKMVRAVQSLGIDYMTVYAFSTENWKRPAEEVGMLMNLLVEFVDKKLEEMNRNGVRIRHIGLKENIDPKVYEKIKYAEERTKDNQKLVLNFAFNYGSRLEITHAVKAIAQEVKDGQILIDDIDEAMISRHLDTAGQPDPDLLIRTSGEMRISNFLLWQIAYSELWISDVYWPEFEESDLWQAIYDYQKRSRRFGGLEGK